jgi:LCP family protein required for cell wall assembly
VTSFGASLRALFGRMGLAVLLCVPVAVGGVVMVNRYIDNEVAKIPRVALTTAPVGSNGVNFLIIGSDSRAFVDNAIDYQAFSDKNTDSAPPRSDTMMVLHADGDRSFAVSFPRDLWVDIPGLGNAKINAAFNQGPQGVVDTLQSNFNVPINYYLEVNFETFEGIVNAIGTVPVYVPGVTRDLFTGWATPYGAGCYHLDGAAALQWVRARSLEILDPKNGKYDPSTGQRWSSLDATADIGRIKRQQDFVKKLGRIAVQRTIDDPLIAPDIVDALMPNLHADTAFNRSALNELVRAFMGLTSGDGAGLQFETLPWDGPTTRGGQSVVVAKQPEADAVLAQLRGEAPPPAPSTTLAPSSQATPLRASDVRVRVLNASGVTGAAATADQAMTNLGFVSGGISNYTGPALTTTQIHYRPGDEAKAQLVAGVVPGGVLTPDATVGGDVVVILGPGFKGIGSSVPKDTASTPTTVPVSPEEACQ